MPWSIGGTLLGGAKFGGEEISGLNSSRGEEWSLIVFICIILVDIAGWTKQIHFTNWVPSEKNFRFDFLGLIMNLRAFC